MASIFLRPRDKKDDDNDQKNDNMDTDHESQDKTDEPMTIDQHTESSSTTPSETPQPTPQVEAPVTPDAEELRRRRLGRFNTVTTSPSALSSSPPKIQLPTTTTTINTPTRPSNALAASLLASSPSSAPSNPFPQTPSPNNNTTPATNNSQILTHPQNLTPNNNRSAPINIRGRSDSMDVDTKSSPGQWPLTPQSPFAFSPSTPSGTNYLQRIPAPGTTPPSNSNLGTSPPRYQFFYLILLKNQTTVHVNYSFGSH